MYIDFLEHFKVRCSVLVPRAKKNLLLPFNFLGTLKKMYAQVCDDKRKYIIVELSSESGLPWARQSSFWGS